MANGVNKVFLIGRLGKDPECKQISSGMVAKFTVATSESYKDKQTGEKKELTEWHRITAWGKLAEIVEQYVKKGSLVCVEGKIKTDKYKNKEGIDVYSTGIVAASLMMLDSKEKSTTPSDYKSVKDDGANPFDFDDVPF